MRLFQGRRTMTSRIYGGLSFRRWCNTAWRVFLALTGIVLAEVCTTPASFGGEWPQFLGPSRNGISNETGLLDAWPEGGPKEVWRASGGVGMSGLAISRGRAITLVQKDGQQSLISLDAKTGKPQWQMALSAEYKNAQGDGPRATPTITDDTVIAFTGEGTLVAANLSDGKVSWSHNVVQDLGGKVADYGMACSPLVIGNLVIVTAGAPRACVVAYHLSSGERGWTA